MTQEDWLKLLQYNVTKLETNLRKKVHVILLSLLEVEVQIPIHLWTAHNTHNAHKVSGIRVNMSLSLRGIH